MRPAVSSHLIGVGQFQMLRQVRAHPEVMVRVCGNYKLPPPNGQQVILPPEAADLLGSCQEPFAMQQLRGSFFAKSHITQMKPDCLVILR